MGEFKPTGDSVMDILLQQIINGLVLGSMYALIALGYTMVYGIINLINFAHGEVIMVGALTSWTIIRWMQEAMPSAPGWLVLLISLLVAFVVCGALNYAYYCYRYVVAAPDFGNDHLEAQLQVVSNLAACGTHRSCWGGDHGDANFYPGNHRGVVGYFDVAGALHQAGARHACHG